MTCCSIPFGIFGIGEFLHHGVHLLCGVLRSLSG